MSASAWIIAGLLVLKLGALLWFAITITEDIYQEADHAEDYD